MASYCQLLPMVLHIEKSPIITSKRCPEKTVSTHAHGHKKSASDVFLSVEPKKKEKEIKETEPGVV